jgi:hypothetical protein
MLAFEEIAVLLSAEPDVGMEKSHVAYLAIGFYEGEKFDRMVALATIDKLVGLDLLSRDRSGYIYLSQKGADEVARTKEGLKYLINELMFR